MRIVAARAMAVTAALLIVGSVRALEEAGVPHAVEECALAAVCATVVMMIVGW